MSGTQFTPLLKLALPPFDSVPWDEALNGNFSILDGAVGKFVNTANFVGVWKNSTSFVVSQVVFDSTDSSEWSCLVAHTSAAAPTTFAQDRTAHPTFWKAVPSSSDAAAAAAQASATAAAQSASQASGSSTAAAASLRTFQQQYYGAATTDPTADPTGGVPTDGDLYFHTTAPIGMRVRSGASWIPISTGAVTEAPINTTTTYGRANAAWTPVVPTTGNTTFSNARLALVSVLPTPLPDAGYMLSDTFDAFNIGYNMYHITAGAPAVTTFHYRGASTVSPVAYRLCPVGILPGNTSNAIGLMIGVDASWTAGGVVTLDRVQWSVDKTGNMQILGSATKPGGGAFIAPSDSRIKNIIGVYTVGLTELLEMTPQHYTYKGNDNVINPDGSEGPPANSDTTTVHIGLIGQDCEPYMPELVTQYSAYIDGVLQNDVRMVDSTAVTMALVNAVKTLNDMNTALAARVAALEAA